MITHRTIIKNTSLVNNKSLSLLCSTGAVACLTFSLSTPAQAMLCISPNDNGVQCSENNSENYYTDTPSTTYRKVQINRYSNIDTPESNSYTQPTVYSQPNQQVEVYKANNYTSNSYTTTPSVTYNSNNSYNQSPENTYSNYNSTNTDTSDFEIARTAALRGDITTLYEYEQRMAGTLFAMYPEYWRLDSNLQQQSASSIVSFVKRYPNSSLAEKLAADYAETKARNFEPSSIKQVADYIQNADKNEACAIGIGDVNGGNSNRLSIQKEKVWLETKLKDKHQLCYQLALELGRSQYVTNTDRQERLYRILRIGKTGEITTLARSMGVQIAYSDLQEIQQNANGFLGRFSLQEFSQKNQYLYLYAIGRLANKSYQEAISQLEYDIRQDNQRGQALLLESTRRMAYRNIAVKRMNMNTDDGFSEDSLRWFRNSLGESFNFEEAEDYAQTAIRFNAWSDVIKAIDSMSQTQQKETMWQYWLARAYQKTGNASSANSIYNQVAQENNYYGFLAKDKTGSQVSLSQLSTAGGTGMPNITPEEHAMMLKNPNFARAFALKDVVSKHANREWNWGVNQAVKNKDVRLLLAAASHADKLGWYARSIYAMEKANKELGVLNVAISHPMPFRNSVVNYSNQVAIDPAWAYGIIRQESRFNIAAKSHVGAGGLMQIMPATGRGIARSFGESYDQTRVNSGNTNIRYGTKYMSNIKNELGGQPVLATAGYNAGPSKARAWLPHYGSLEADQYVESIAYYETKDYVKRVMENATIYGARLNNPKQISQRMGTIYPR